MMPQNPICFRTRWLAYAAPVVAVLLVLGNAGCTSFPKAPWQAKATPPASATATTAGKPTAENSPYGVKSASFEDAGDTNKSIKLEDFSPKNITATTKRLTGKGPNRELAEQYYNEGDALYRQAVAAEGAARGPLFVQAAEKFAAAAERLPKSAVEQDSLFMAGESYFFADYYVKSNEYYEKLVKAFPNNRYLDTVDARRFAIGKFWLDTNRQSPESMFNLNLVDQTRPWRDMRGQGLRVFDKIRVDDPTGKLADDATLAAGNEHFAAGKFGKADEFYTDLRKSYPTSEHQFLAHFLGLKAKLNTYLGPNYTGQSLDEGEKLIKQIRRQFPKDAAQEREFLDRASAEIRYKRAERLFKMGSYYDNRAEYRAAQHYFSRILKEFNDTPFAPQADERIAAMQGKPPVPTQKLKWIVDAIPQKDRVETLIRATKKDTVTQTK